MDERGGKYMRVIQNSRTKGKMEACLQRGVQREEARELRDGPGLKG